MLTGEEKILTKYSTIFSDELVNAATENIAQMCIYKENQVPTQTSLFLVLLDPCT